VKSWLKSVSKILIKISTELFSYWEVYVIALLNSKYDFIQYILIINNYYETTFLTLLIKMMTYKLLICIEHNTYYIPNLLAYNSIYS